MTVETTAPAHPTYGQYLPVTVHFDDLDAFGFLHNTRHPLLVARAWDDCLAGHGIAYDGDWSTGDVCYAVKELQIGYEAPVTRHGRYLIHLWIERLGNTGLTHGFRLCSADGTTTHARGRRVLVRLDSASRTPTPWTNAFRTTAAPALTPTG
jgi:acyl-CoA thioester hydrolase